MTAPVCAGCGDPLPERIAHLGARWCGPRCADRHMIAVIAREMRGETTALKGRPPRKWCRECGADLPPDATRGFCGADCRRSYRKATRGRA